MLSEQKVKLINVQNQLHSKTRTILMEHSSKLNNELLSETNNIQKELRSAEAELKKHQSALHKKTQQIIADNADKLNEETRTELDSANRLFKQSVNDYIENQNSLVDLQRKIFSEQFVDGSLFSNAKNDSEKSSILYMEAGKLWTKDDSNSKLTALAYLNEANRLQNSNNVKIITSLDSIRSRLINQRLDKNLYLEALDLFKNQEFESCFIKLSQAELISPDINKIKQSKLLVQQILQNRMFKNTTVSVDESLMPGANLKELIQNGAPAVNEQLIDNQQHLEFVKEAKAKIDQALSSISKQLELTNLKIGGNEEFNKGVTFHDMANSLNSLDQFQESLRHYKNALEKFSQGSEHDERFIECIQICQSSIMDINLIKASIEVSNALVDSAGLVQPSAGFTINSNSHQNNDLDEDTFLVLENTNSA